MSAPFSLQDMGQLTTLKDKKSLKDVAKENPTQIGDPVSLKAETSKNVCLPATTAAPPRITT
jgi:hypothetical protein